MQTQSFLPVLENLKVARSIDADIPSQDFNTHTQMPSTIVRIFYHFLTTRWLPQTSLPSSMQLARMSKCSSQRTATWVPKTYKFTWSNTFGKDGQTV
jgi:hypothetical protein